MLIPPRPVALIHFLGGAFVATAPQATYRRLLEFLANKGFVIVATPFLNTLDHRAIAEQVLQSFDRTVRRLTTTSQLQPYLPVYGLGHSMGCKLHLLIGSLFPVQRSGNILVSFNNFSARQAIPFMEPLAFSPAMEFVPSPLETNRLIQDQYRVRRNLLVQFTNDEIDQTLLLVELLQERFPNMTSTQRLPGSHLTPLGQDIGWKTGSVFTAFDAVGQWMRQELYRELAELERVLLLWLDPLSLGQQK